MKKLGVCALVSFAMVAASAANADALSEGDQLVGGSLGFTLSSFDNAVTFGGNYERGFNDDLLPGFNLGVGALLQYANYSYLNVDASVTTIAAQANLHYDLGPDSFQPYGGLLLGYSSYSAGFYSGGAFGLGGQIGGRYWFQDNLAATVRLNGTTAGASLSVISGGVDYRF